MVAMGNDHVIALIDVGHDYHRDSALARMMVVLLSYLCLCHPQDKILMANQTANLDIAVSLVDDAVALHGGISI